MIDITGTYTDQYQLAMAQVYFLKGNAGRAAVFDYFFRKLPFNGGYAVFAGLEDFITILSGLRFNESDIDFLFRQGMDTDFLEYLKQFRFTGNVYAIREGDMVFPTHPVVSVEADMIQAQIIETLLLNILNFQTLVATKARRIRYSAGDRRKLADFGLRRAQGLGGYHASRAAMVGGFDSTSNVRAGRDYRIPVTGTMAHSFVQSYDQELSAFRDFAAARPDDCILLVDTYNTLNSGVPNAVIIAKEMEKQGRRLKGIRLDSGDLAYLAKKSRLMLDEAGLPYVMIAASNQLDEYVIKSLLDQQAPIDIFGVGTRLVTGYPDAALDGVYKLAFAADLPRMKLSETPAKISIPFLKQVFRVFDENGNFYGADAVARFEEEDVETIHHPFEPLKSLDIRHCRKEPLLFKIMENGKRTAAPFLLDEIAEYSRQRFERLPDEFKRFENPHIYKVGLSSLLKHDRDELIRQIISRW